MSSAIGLYRALMIPSKPSGIANGFDCCGTCSGNGGSDSGAFSVCRGAARNGSTVFRNDVKMSERSLMYRNGKSLLLIVSALHVSLLLRDLTH